MMFRTTIPIHNNQCAISKGASKCIKRDKHNGYEVRTYISAVPFSIEIYSVDSNGGNCILIHVRDAISYGRNKQNVQSDRSNGGKISNQRKE